MHLLPVLVALLSVPPPTRPYLDFCQLSCGCDLNPACDKGLCHATRCVPEHPDRDWRSSVLHHHNRLRSEVATGRYLSNPGSNNETLTAANMRTLNYDMELEFVAGCDLYTVRQSIEGTCRRTATYSYGDIAKLYYKGEAPGRGDEEFVAKLLEKWGDRSIPEDEIRNFTGDPVRASATQIAWARTRSIGCVRCRGRDEPELVLVVCYYAPAGNVRGESVFEAGEPSSACPVDAPPATVSGLCGAESQPRGFNVTGLWAVAGAPRASSRSRRGIPVVVWVRCRIFVFVWFFVL